MIVSFDWRAPPQNRLSSCSGSSFDFANHGRESIALVKHIPIRAKLTFWTYILNCILDINCYLYSGIQKLDCILNCILDMNVSKSNPVVIANREHWWPCEWAILEIYYRYIFSINTDVFSHQKSWSAKVASIDGRGDGQGGWQAPAHSHIIHYSVPARPYIIFLTFYIL